MNNGLSDDKIYGNELITNVKDGINGADKCILSLIGGYLKKEGYTVSVAESLTAGKLQDTLASRTGASSYFDGGITAYNIDAKVELLRVDRDWAASCNCVSIKTVAEMVIGVKERFKSDYAIATTGYAEAYGDEPAHAYIAVISPDNSVVFGKLKLDGFETRTLAREAVVNAAINLLGSTCIYNCSKAISDGTSVK